MDEPTRFRTLGETIRARRVELGWTQQELAVRIAGMGEICHQSDVSRLERGRVGLPRRARLERIAAALDLAVGDLLARSGWAGADAAFRPADLVVASPADQPAAVPCPPVAASVAAPAPSTELGSRLHEAMAQAHELRARTAELLRTSATTLNRVGHPWYQGGDLTLDPAAGGDGEGVTHEP